METTVLTLDQTSLFSVGGGFDNVERDKTYKLTIKRNIGSISKDVRVIIDDRVEVWTYEDCKAKRPLPKNLAPKESIEDHPKPQYLYDHLNKKYSLLH